MTQRQGRIEPPSGGKYLMSTGSDLISLIASRQNLDDYQKKHWTGSFPEYLDVVQQRSEGDPNGLPADLRHDHELWDRGGRRQQGEAGPLQVLRGPRQPGRRRHLRAGTDPDQPGQHPHERRQRLRHGAPRPAPARAGRQFQEHAGPAAQEGPGALFARRSGGPLQLRLEGAGPRGRGDLRRLPDARGAAPPDPPGASRRDHGARSTRAGTPTASTS